MNLQFGDSYRRFLLGIASEEDQVRSEEAILAGELDAAEIGILEDDLIDDYVFGDLSGEEQKAFNAHFLSTAKRKQRLTFALALIGYARKQPATAPKKRMDSGGGHGQRFMLPWPGSAVAALAAIIVLSCLAGYQQVVLRRQAQQSRNAQNEIARLQGALASRTNPPQADGVQEAKIVLPRLMRDVLQTPVFQISSQARLVRIDLNLIAPASGTYTVELYKDDRRILSEELDASRSDARAIVVPASLLNSGNYLLQFKNSNPLVQQSFRVQRN